jgi:hypothetical protein
MDRRMLSLRINGMFLLGSLVVQYVLGMYVNLFVAFPNGTLTTGQLWQFAWSQWALSAHIVLAILLLLGAIVFCVRAVLFKEKRRIIGSVLGLLGILAAGASGAIFIPSQTDIYSYAMSLSFLVAFVAYSWVLFSSNRSES